MSLINSDNSLADPSKRRILIVDGDPAVLHVAGAALGQAGYDCTKSHAAPAALALLGTQPFDLVILDVAMHGMDGFDLTERAFDLVPDLAVVVMSGATEIDTPVKAIRAGSTDYLIKPFDVDELLNCVSRALAKKETTVERKRAQTQITDWKAAARAFALCLDARNKEPEGHPERVLAYSLLLGRQIGLTAEIMTALEMGARLHDIGKIGVPDSVLKKPFPLNEDEWALMRLHPAQGQQMVRSMKLPETVAQIVGQHHEKWDGSGYPQGLKEKEIHIGARVFAVADAFDAITSERVYRRARGYQDALEEILLNSGTQFDPEIVDAFANIDQEEWIEIKNQCTEERSFETNPS
jgi:response regulator RpfG family c-di-GMP phosphodiesterase